MPLPQQFLQELPNKTDEQLYEIFSHADDYLPEAIAAAKEELQRRNLPPERVESLEVTSQQKRANDNRRADEPLGWSVRIIMFLSSATLIPAMVGLAIMPARYACRGFKKKATECWTCWGLGFVFWLLLFLVHFFSK